MTSSNISMPGRKPRPQDHAARAAIDPASPELHDLRAGSSPLSWWRMLPAGSYRAVDYLDVRSALDEIALLVEGTEVEPAILGDAEAAIALTISLMPIEAVGLKTDIVLTCVLVRALEGDLKAALVLAHLVDRASPTPPLAADLCASWFIHYLRHSPSGRSSAEERAIMKAIRAFDPPRPARQAEPA
jgi:hypothetical protein